MLGEPSPDTQLGEPSLELSRGAPRLAITAGISQEVGEANGAADTPPPGDHPATFVALAPAGQPEIGGSVTDRLLHDMSAMNDQRIASNRAASLAAAPAAPELERGAPGTAAAPAVAAAALAAPATGAQASMRTAPGTAAAPAATTAAPAAAARRPNRVAEPAGKAIARKRPSAAVTVNHEGTRKTYRVRLPDGTSKGFQYSSEENKEQARQKALAFAASSGEQV